MSKAKEANIMFNPFDKVLVRQGDEYAWMPTIFALYDESEDDPYTDITGTAWKECIPYEGNENLVGKVGDERWKPNVGEIYYFAFSDSCGTSVRCKYWQGNDFDKKELMRRNVFECHEEAAEFARLIMKVVDFFTKESDKD